MARLPNNYLDLRQASDLIKPIKALLDISEDSSEGSIQRFMRLEQIDGERSQLTSYMVGNTWGALYLLSSGLVGESAFLIDGADIKNRLSTEPWMSSPLRLQPTKRKALRLECRTGNLTNEEKIDHIETQLYGGSLDEFEPPVINNWQPTQVNIIDGFQLCRRGGIVNFFSKYGNDKNRAVWFDVQPNSERLSIYGSEYSGADAGISVIRINVNVEQSAAAVNFGIPARHLAKVFQLVDISARQVSFRLTDDLRFVQFWSAKGWLLIPCQPTHLNRTLHRNAPALFNGELQFDHAAQRIFGAKELVHKVTIHKPRKQEGGGQRGLRLECEDNYLNVSKVVDKLKRDQSYCLLADPTGLETTWKPVVANYDYLLIALSATLKYCQQMTSEELYELDYNDNQPEEGDYDEWALSEVNDEFTSEHLIAITQNYMPQKELWCLYLDPVPYTGDCSIYLAITVEARLGDQIEDEY